MDRELDPRHPLQYVVLLSKRSGFAIPTNNNGNFFSTLGS